MSLVNHALSEFVAESARKVAYSLVSRLFHQPYALRILADVMRRFPGLNRILPTTLVARRDAVAELTRRTADFSHTAYTDNLAAGPFVIARDEDDAVAHERTALWDWLPAAAPGSGFGPIAGSGSGPTTGRRSMPGASDAGYASLNAARKAIGAMRESGTMSIDLIDGYMMELVWRELAAPFGPQADAILELPDSATLLVFLKQLRRLGAFLVVGWLAPASVRTLTSQCADQVHERVERALARVAANAGVAGPASPVNAAAFRQRLVGLMWVGHPATVQAGALLLQELFDRPEVLAALQERALRLGDSVWTDADFRDEIRLHVLELLRFRPIFPFLPRIALRECTCDVGGGVTVTVKAGARVVAMTAGAAFDDEANWAPDVYRPGRYRGATPWGRHRADELLMFGFGTRQCVAYHVVVETLTSALTGMLTLPRLRWAKRELFQPRIEYDGIIVKRMQVAFDPLG